MWSVVCMGIDAWEFVHYACAAVPVLRSDIRGRSEVRFSKIQLYFQRNNFHSFQAGIAIYITVIMFYFLISLLYMGAPASLAF